MRAVHLLLLLLLVAPRVAAQPPLLRPLVVRADQRSPFALPAKHGSLGLEDINHAISGGSGLYAQLLHGESFEEAPLGEAVSPDNGDYWGEAAAAGDASSLGGGLGGCAARLARGAAPPQVSRLWLPYAERPAAAAAPPPAAYALVRGGGAPRGPHGAQHQAVTKLDGDPHNGVGVLNFGLGCVAGLSLAPGRDYRGAAWLRSPAAAAAPGGAAAEPPPPPPPPNVTAALLFPATGEVLASAPLVLVPGAAHWALVRFTLTPSPSTAASSSVYACGSLDPAAVPSAPRPPPAALTSCPAAFALLLSTPNATLEVDYVELQPGGWGVLPAPHAGRLGLPARADVAAALAPLQLGYLRVGGSSVLAPGYRWRALRGPRPRRQPLAGYWQPEPGGRAATSAGFGPFEAADLAQALGAAAVVTLNLGESPGEVAAFVEYCWAGPDTALGALRHRDGHPAPYNVSVLELGNEEPALGPVCEHTLAVAAAADAAARRAGAPPLTLVLGYMLSVEDLRPGGLGRAALEACVRSLRPIGYARVLFDAHVDAFAPSAAAWEDGLFARWAAMTASLNASDLRLIVLESNAWPPGAAALDHGLARAVGAAAYTSAAQRAAAASGSVAASGYTNAAQAWQGPDPGRLFSQGALFVLPNATLAQPPARALTLVAASSAGRPRLLPVASPGWSGGPADGADAVALASGDGCSLAVRVAAWRSAAPGPWAPQPPLEGAALTLDGLNVSCCAAAGAGAAWRVVSATVLAGRTGEDGEQNTPGEPGRVAARPAPGLPAGTPYQPGMALPARPPSLTVVELACVPPPPGAGVA